MFRITGGKGFHARFDNGYTVSVQFGPGNYCDNYEAEYKDAAACGSCGSILAEIAVINDGGGLIWWDLEEHQTAQGYVSANDVAKVIGSVASMKPRGISYMSSKTWTAKPKRFLWAWRLYYWARF